MYTALYLGQNDDEGDGGDMTSFDVIVEYNVFRDAVDSGYGSDVGAPKGTYYPCRSPITIRNMNNAIVRYNYIENSYGAGIYVRDCEGGYWYELSDPGIDNNQSPTDKHLKPLMIGPFSLFDPSNAKGPIITFNPSFNRNQEYRLTGSSLLIDGGVNVGLSFKGIAPDIGSNEFIDKIENHVLRAWSEFNGFAS